MRWLQRKTSWCEISTPKGFGNTLTNKEDSVSSLWWIPLCQMCTRTNRESFLDRRTEISCKSAESPTGQKIIVSSYSVIEPKSRNNEMFNWFQVSFFFLSFWAGPLPVCLFVSLDNVLTWHFYVFWINALILCKNWAFCHFLKKIGSSDWSGIA